MFKGPLPVRPPSAEDEDTGWAGEARAAGGKASPALHRSLIACEGPVTL